MAIVRFDTVTKQFAEDFYGVKEVSFSVEPGEFLFVTGPSGSGKTTLMRLLLKEYSLSDGEIFFHDEPISTIKPRHVHLHRRRIGAVFQDYKLIPEMNIWENIALPLSVAGRSHDEIEQRVTDLLTLIKLPEKALLFPSQLSGGEAQRVGIARALASGPELIIADEPTGNLDPETALSIARLLRKINELGTTVLIATHDSSILAAYPETRMLILEKGQLISDQNTTRGHHKVTKASHGETAATSHRAAPKTTSEAEKKMDSKSEAAETHAEKKPHRIDVESVAEKAPIPEETSAMDEAAATNAAETAPKKSWWKKVFKKSSPKSEETTEAVETDSGDKDTDEEKEEKDLPVSPDEMPTKPSKKAETDTHPAEKNAKAEKPAKEKEPKSESKKTKHKD